MIDGIPDGKAASRHAHHGTAHEVDHRNDDTGGRISLDILRGTVHGTEEVGFFLDLHTTIAGFLIGNGAGIKVRVDGHLLTGHGIERKSRRNLGNSFGTFVDNNKLNNDQHNKDDGTDDQIVAADKFSERRNNITGITGRKDQSRGGYV